MKRLFICSPYAASGREELEENLYVARRAMLRALMQGDAPFVPHLLYTQVLDDDISYERKLGREAALKMLEVCDDLVVVGNRITTGMEAEIAEAEAMRKPIRKWGLS